MTLTKSKYIPSIFQILLIKQFEMWHVDIPAFFSDAIALLHKKNSDIAPNFNSNYLTLGSGDKFWLENCLKERYC